MNTLYLNVKHHWVSSVKPGQQFKNIRTYDTKMNHDYLFTMRLYDQDTMLRTSEISFCVKTGKKRKSQHFPVFTHTHTPLMFNTK